MTTLREDFEELIRRSDICDCQTRVGAATLHGYTCPAHRIVGRIRLVVKRKGRG